MTAHPLDQVLAEIRSLADSERVKGTYLESLAKQFLLNDATQRQQFSNVWTWREWPDRPAHFTKNKNLTTTVLVKIAEPLDRDLINIAEIAESAKGESNVEATA